MTIPPYLQNFFEPWLIFLSEDPLLRIAQIGMLLIGALIIFLVFYTTRDILLRTNSFIGMFLSILLVAALPIVGFFLYILLRPPRTLKEREMEALLYTILQKVEGAHTSFHNKSEKNDDVKKGSSKVIAKK